MTPEHRRVVQQRGKAGVEEWPPQFDGWRGRPRAEIGDVWIDQLETTGRLRVAGDRPVNGNHRLFVEAVKLLASVLVADDDLRKASAVADDQEGDC
jgi:hypothetical protein